MTMPLVNEAYLNLIPYVPGKPIAETERELGISGCIKLASNENPLGPSPLAVQAMAEALRNVHDYPDGASYYLKQKLASQLGVASDQLILGNGSNELIEMLVRTCVRPDEHVLLGECTFVAYKLAAQAAGRGVVEVPLTPDLRYDLQRLAQAATAQTKMVFIGNPNNPTGTYVSKKELDAFFDAIAPDVIVVLDEAYLEYVDASDYPNGLNYVKQRERTVVLRTFSKCYGLAGLRVGYGVSDPTLIDYLNRGRLPFNVNSLAQVGALAALDDVEHIERSRRLNSEQRTRLTQELSARGFAVAPSQANFLLVDFKRNGGDLFNALLRRGVIVRPMVGYGLVQSLRITIGTREQNDKLLSSIDKEL